MTPARPLTFPPILGSVDFGLCVWLVETLCRSRRAYWWGQSGAPGHWEPELGGYLLSQAVRSGMPLKENGALVVPSANGHGEAMMFVRCSVSP